MSRTSLFEGALALCIVTSFVPYPAVPLGRATGLQLSQFLALVVFALSPVRRRAGRHVLFFLLWCAAYAVSLSLDGIAGDLLDQSRALHVAVAEPLALAPLLVGGVLADFGFVRVLRCAAVGVLMNVAVGALQFYDFRHDRLPFVWLYSNPSFASVKANAQVIALYIHRPFGLFSEPSALAAAIAPWLLLFAYAWQKRVGGRLVRAALVGGLAIVVASRSGFALPLIVGALAIFFYEATRTRRRAWVASPMLPVLMVPGGAAGIYYAIRHLGRALTISSANASYSTRAATLTDAFHQVTSSPVRMLSGVGPGQAYLRFQSDIAAGVAHVEQAAATVGIDSVSLRFLAENGLVIGGAILVVGAVWTAASLRGSRAPFVGATVALILAAAMTLVTSYEALSPMWLALGLLLNWKAFTVEPTT